MNWNIIEKARMFESIPPERIRKIFFALEPRNISLKKNNLLIRDGQYVDFLGIVEKGELIATKLYQDGTQSLLLKFLPSYMIGADAAATKKKICTYYVTASKNSVIHLFSYQKIAKPGYIEESDRLLIMESVLALIAGENLRKMSKIEILSRRKLRDRILTFLSIQQSLVNQYNFSIPYNRQELADYLCVNRSALSHELKSMEKENLIRCRKNHFEILDAPLYRRE